MSTRAIQIRTAIHSALVTSVKAVVKAHGFGKDAWFNFIHDKSPVDARYNTPTRDPAQYAPRFLGEFLEHA